MPKREGYEARTEEFLLPLMEEHKFELVDVEYVKETGTRYLRAYTDKESGIAADDCEVINRKLSKRLGAKDFITDSYILEVNSLRLRRPLKKDKDPERSIDKEVDIKLYCATGKQKDFTRILKSYGKARVTMEQEDNTEKILTRSNIAPIQLAFDFQAVRLIERTIGG